MDDEIFQLEAVDRTDMSGNVKWVVRGKNKKYWQLGAGTSNIVCDAVTGTDPKSHFTIEWHGAQVSIYNVVLLIIENTVELGYNVPPRKRKISTYYPSVRNTRVYHT